MMLSGNASDEVMSSGPPELMEPSAFAEPQRYLAAYNRVRLLPGLGGHAGQAEQQECEVLRFEAALIDGARAAAAPWLVDVPTGADEFVAWFEHLRDVGPGQGDRLFPWLATEATYAQMRWFLAQEVAGEAGFEDLLAVTQVKMPVRAKLEMARNYWDEMGRGNAKGMHGPMLERLAGHFALHPTPETTVEESLALGNLMMGLASNRRYAFHSVGALGVIELTAPGRAAFVTQGLRRLGVPARKSHYFALHATLDVKHSEAWNREVLVPLVAEDPRRAQAIAEGAVMRLWCGLRCFERYRGHFRI
jgi:hypothetical protein